MRYAGAIALGTKVYFTPSNQNNVGILNTATNVWSIVSLAGTSAATGSFKYTGGALVDTKIYFAPRDAMSIGVLDTATNQFSTIAFDYNEPNILYTKYSAVTSHRA